MRERDRRGDVACVCTRTCERAYDILKSIDNLCHVPASVGARRTCMLVWPLKTITRSMRYRARVLVKRFTRRAYLLYYHYCNVTIVWHTVQKLMFIYFQCVHAVVGIGTTTYIILHAPIIASSYRCTMYMWRIFGEQHRPVHTNRVFDYDKKKLPHTSKKKIAIISCRNRYDIQLQLCAWIVQESLLFRVMVVRFELLDESLSSTRLRV